MIDYNKAPEFPNYVCLSLDEYSGINKQSIEFLGTERFLTNNNTVNLKGVLDNDTDTVSFFKWFEERTLKGLRPFRIKTRLFGELKEYILSFISDIKHTTSNGVSVITFSAEVLVSRDIFNTPPSALHQTVVVEKNSIDNVIILDGFDSEGNALSYEIQVPPLNGIIQVSGKNVLYTPTRDFMGDDCFSFVVHDKYSSSKPNSVDIIVADAAISDSIITYYVDNTATKLYVNGNYHYRNSLGSWVKVYNSWLDLSTTPVADGMHMVQIASFDAVIDNRSKNDVRKIVIDKWGNRQNIDYLFAGFTNLTSISHSASAGECQATSAKGLYEGLVWASGTLPGVNTSKVERFDNFMKNADVSGIGPIDMSSAISAESAFEGATMASLPVLDTSKCKIFTNMFKDSHIGCLGGIDTTNALTTVGMFDGANFTNPDAAAIADIVASKNQPWVNAQSCKVQILSIEEVTPSTADISHIGGTADSTGKYKVIIDTSTLNGTASYSWVIDEGKNATIVNGQGTEEVEIKSTDIDISGDILKIHCIVTDGSGASNSGTYTFPVERVSAYATLLLPVHTGVQELRSFIEDKVGASYSGEVLLINNSVIPPVKTGDLSKYSKVVLRNFGNIQAYSRWDGRVDTPWEKTAFEATSPIEIDNQGSIAANGGKGARGAKGADDTYWTGITYLESVGTHTITAPAGAVRARVSLSGGGGGGSAYYSYKLTGGGYRGETLELRTVSVTAGKSYTYTIGAGGAGGKASNTDINASKGKRGGDTSIFGLTARGGAGGDGNGYKGSEGAAYSGPLGDFKDGKRNGRNYGGQAGLGGHGGDGCAYDQFGVNRNGYRGSGGGSADCRHGQSCPGRGGNGIILIEWEIKRIGGAGGEGGQGWGYGWSKNNNWMLGKPGHDSTPPGGNKGSRGYDGGWSGQPGEGGGMPPGKAVIGNSYIVWTGGHHGHISGDIV